MRVCAHHANSAPSRTQGGNDIFIVRSYLGRAKIVWLMGAALRIHAGGAGNQQHHQSAVFQAHYRSAKSASVLNRSSERQRRDRDRPRSHRSSIPFLSGFCSHKAVSELFSTASLAWIFHTPYETIPPKGPSSNPFSDLSARRGLSIYFINPVSRVMEICGLDLMQAPICHAGMPARFQGYSGRFAGNEFFPALAVAAAWALAH